MKSILINNLYFKSFILLILFLASSKSLFPQQEKYFERFIDEYQKNKNVPSISAGVAANGRIIWLGAKGFADVENFVPASPKTLYRIASISKSITAVAIMQLAEKGEINLDDDARKFITYFPKKKWGFTIRHLLTHTSGIRDYKEGEFESKVYYETTRDAVSILLNDSLEFEPGTKFLYTTLGYNLLAAVIEKASGLSYLDYLKRNIFEPGGMNHTTADIQKEIILMRAKGYIKNEYRELQNAPLADLSIKYAGGGLLSTSEDLLKFAINLSNGKLIKSETLDLMLVPNILKNGDTTNYGLGFDIKKDERDSFYFSHAGAGTGFTSFLLVYPKEKIAAVHLLNIRDRNLENPAVTLAKILTDKKYIPPKRSLADRMLEITLAAGLDSALVEYENIKRDSAGIFTIDKDELIFFGYDLIAVKKTSEAIKFFKLFVSEFLDFPKAYTGLADAYYKDGNRGLALKNFRTVLRLDPSNSYAAYMIKKLEGS